MDGEHHCVVDIVLQLVQVRSIVPSTYGHYLNCQDAAGGGKIESRLHVRSWTQTISYRYAAHES